MPRSKTSGPVVSIITVVYNAEQYLEQAIQSVISQTYPDLEFIIVDGGSTDGSLDIIRRYDDRISTWISEPDDGQFDAMNKGSAIASGDYALYLCADDYLYSPTSIEEAIRSSLAGSDTPPPLIVGKVICAVGDELLDWEMPVKESWIEKFNPPHQSAFIGREIYKNIFYNPLFFTAGDYDMWSVVRQRDLFRFKFVDTIISVYRVGGVSSHTDSEFVKYVEYEISNYFRHGKFRLSHLLKSALVTFLKRLFAGIFGERNYYRFFLYNIYRFRKKFF